MRRLAAGLALVMALGCGTALAADIPGGRYGTVHVSEPQGALRGFVVLYSAMSGWNAADTKAAEALAQHALLVVGVDTPTYLANLEKVTEACHHVVGDAEAISHQLQRELKSKAYFTPILAGMGQGGTLAEVALQSAATNTIAGAVSVDPTVELDARFHPCPQDPTIVHDAGLPGFWSIAATGPVAAQTQALVARLTKDGAKVERRDFAAGASESDMLVALAATHLGSRAPDEEDVSDLPLVELPAAERSNMLAVIVSGDGGWRDLDKTIARKLQSSGISVVGLDSLRYFWSHKTPEQAARDLTRVINTYEARWHATSVALIGYSFGADVLPFVYNRLPPRPRGQVAMISLLGFAKAADFEIRVTGWLGMPPSAEALPVGPEIAKVPGGMVQCFYGEDEVDTVCPELGKLGVAVIKTEGSHHFGRDYEKLAQVILNGWRRRMTKG